MSVIIHACESGQMTKVVDVYRYSLLDNGCIYFFIFHLNPGSRLHQDTRIKHLTELAVKDLEKYLRHCHPVLAPGASYKLVRSKSRPVSLLSHVAPCEILMIINSPKVKKTKMIPPTKLLRSVWLMHWEKFGLKSNLERTVTFLIKQNTSCCIIFVNCLSYYETKLSAFSAISIYAFQRHIWIC